MLKHIVDQLNPQQEIFILPTFFIIVYGALRLFFALFKEMRGAVCQSRTI
jgi:hypothetical protein